MNGQFRRALTKEEFLAIVRAGAEFYGGQAEFGRAIGYSAQQFNDILAGRRPCTDKFARKMGFERIESFKRLKVNPAKLKTIG